MIEVVITVLIVYILYYFISINRFDKSGHYKKAKQQQVTDYEALPAEVKYFIMKYNIDLNKVNLRGVLKLSGLLLGIDIAIVSIICVLIFKDNIVPLLIVGAIAIIPIYLISLKIVSRSFKKRGLLKDEQNKWNREKMARLLG